MQAAHRPDELSIIFGCLLACSWQYAIHVPADELCIPLRGAAAVCAVWLPPDRSTPLTLTHKPCASAPPVPATAAWHRHGRSGLDPIRWTRFKRGIGCPDGAPIHPTFPTSRGSRCSSSCETVANRNCEPVMLLLGSASCGNRPVRRAND